MSNIAAVNIKKNPVPSQGKLLITETLKNGKTVKRNADTVSPNLLEYYTAGSRSNPLPYTVVSPAGKTFLVDSPWVSDVQDTIVSKFVGLPNSKTKIQGGFDLEEVELKKNARMDIPFQSSGKITADKNSVINFDGSTASINAATGSSLSGLVNDKYSPTEYWDL